MARGRRVLRLLQRYCCFALPRILHEDAGSCAPGSPASVRPLRSTSGRGRSGARGAHWGAARAHPLRSAHPETRQRAGPLAAAAPQRATGGGSAAARSLPKRTDEARPLKSSACQLHLSTKEHWIDSGVPISDDRNSSATGPALQRRIRKEKTPRGARAESGAAADRKLKTGGRSRLYWGRYKLPGLPALMP